MEFQKGVDISSLLEIEKNGGTFRIGHQEKDIFAILKMYNINSIRLRLWVDPLDELGKPYLGGTNDLATTLQLAKRAKQAGMSILLDFHYSDFWADPGKQFLPKKWQNLTFSELTAKVYTYTQETLAVFQENNLAPEFIQLGNEITNGMLWPHGKLYADDSPIKGGFDRLGELLKKGIAAAKSVFPNTKIILHVERSGDYEFCKSWFDEIRSKGIDFAIIGLSYYPYWHGSLENMLRNVAALKKRYPQEIMIVETSYAFTTTKPVVEEDHATLIINQESWEALENKPPYSLDEIGQCRYLLTLLLGCQQYGIAGLYYWEPAWLPIKGTSWASKEGIEYIKETKKAGNEWANQGLFSYAGEPLMAFRILSQFTIKEKK